MKLQKNERKEENSLVQMKINSKVDEHFEGRQYSFLVQTDRKETLFNFQGVSCTGSMISEGWDIFTVLLFRSIFIDSDWVITAHHCIEMNNNFKPHRKFKDKVT